jgi:hypothetical protein
MAKGTSDPATVEAETKGQKNGLGGMSDEQWNDAAPEGEDLGSAEITGYGRNPDEDEPAEDTKSKSKSPFADLNPPDKIEPINVTAELLKVSTGSGAAQAQFEVPWNTGQKFVEAYRKALELRFGEISVFGCTVKNTASSTDADGAVRYRVTFEIPESQRHQAALLFEMSGKAGPLQVEPTQMTLDDLLTHNSRDDEESDPAGTFSDVDGGTDGK